ncbi:substrate-binding domain-containing protein [Lapillicoccus sp.]|uniref:substrate-binding domain-containing protein n=1 Tax=Lapillicoccus sp. TaxID=1909287 RepID=UPI003264951F
MVGLCNTRESDDLQLLMRDLLLQHQSDAAILTVPLRHSAAAIARRWLDRVPLMTVNRRVSSQRLVSFHLDNVLAGRLAARHLVALGHRQIGFVGGRPSASTDADRLSGVRAALRVRGLTLRPRHRIDGEFICRSGYNAATRMLGEAERPTAVVCADDHIALGVTGATLDLGPRILEDPAVVGFDDGQAASLRRMPLTTVRQPVAEMGRSVYQLDRIDRIGGRSGHPVEVVLAPTLVVRRTCGADGKWRGHRPAPRTAGRAGSAVGSGGR